MKLTKTATKIKPGMTLIEITVVILVLLTLISVLFIGARMYKEGADRAACILNIRNVQQAVRSHQNLHEKNDQNHSAPSVLTVADDIFSAAAGADPVANPAVERYLNVPECPSEGTYAYAVVYPSSGVVVSTCSLEVTNTHVPKSVSGW